jgi:hypothetical protein
VALDNPFSIRQKSRNEATLADIDATERIVPMIQYSGNCLEEKYNVRSDLGGSTNKKVLVSRFDREAASGFVNPQSYLLAEGLELLSQTGAVSVIPYEDIKLVCFVRDFQQGEPRKELRLFTTRPKMEGLWIRMRFRDGDAMDGVLANNLLQFDPYGFSVIPPDPGFQNQRVFVPKAALSAIQVLGVVGSPLRTKKPKPVTKEQLEMFEKTGEQ